MDAYGHLSSSYVLRSLIARYREVVSCLRRKVGVTLVDCGFLVLV